MSITCISFKFSDVVTQEKIADKNLTQDLLSNMILIVYLSLNGSSFIKEKYQPVRAETVGSKSRLTHLNSSPQLTACASSDKLSNHL